MNEETKESIEAVMLLLEDTLNRCHVSMAFDPNGNRLIFLDTESYMTDGKIDGISFDIDMLVGGSE